MLSRHTATPDVALELQRNWYQTDVRAILPTIAVPTLLLSHGPDHAQAEHIRSLMPNAELITFSSRPGPAGAGRLGGVLGPDARMAGRPPSRRGKRLDPGDGAVHRHRGVNSEAGGAGRRRMEWASGATSRDRAGRGSLAGGGPRSTPLGTASSRRSMARPEPSGARGRYLRTPTRDLGSEIRAGVHTGEFKR